MSKAKNIGPMRALVTLGATLVYASFAAAADVASVATGGYARGLQTKEMMHKVDKNGDGKVSHDEYIAHQIIVFEAMGPGRSGTVGPKEFLGKGLGGSSR